MAGPGTNNNLPVQNLINVSVVLSPNAAQAPNVNTAMIVGASNIIDVVQRFRTYSGLTGVATDFGTSAPEYLAAKLFFGQNPQPSQLYIGRWAQTATAGILYCGVLTTAQQAIGLWQANTAGQFKIAVDGGALTNVTCGTMAGAANLNAVAAIIQTAVRALAGAFANVSVIWNGSQFVFTSGTTGATSAVAALTAGNAADISAQLLGTAGTLYYTANGIALETPSAAVAALDGLVYAYGYTFAQALAADINDAGHQTLAGVFEALANKHVYGISSTNVNCLASGSTTDVAYLIGPLGSSYNRSFVQYSSDPVNGLYVAASWLGRAITVPFTASNSVIAMMFKQEPGVTAESLTTAQMNALAAKNGNAYVNYNNGTSILQNGTMGSGQFFDVIQDIDWLAYAIQNNVWNLLYTTSTKIPQTDAGMNMIASAIDQACQQGVANGTLAPGTWTVAGFGQIRLNSFLDKGYYIYQPPIASQSTADRSARKSVPFQIAAKIAGAVQSVNITVYVNQ